MKTLNENELVEIKDEAIFITNITYGIALRILGYSFNNDFKKVPDDVDEQDVIWDLLVNTDMRPEQIYEEAKSLGICDGEDGIVYYYEQ
jgi:hypothetical protein